MKNMITSSKRFAREYPEMLAEVQAAVEDRGEDLNFYVFKSALMTYDPDDDPRTFFATFYPAWVEEARADGTYGPLSYSWIQVQGIKHEYGAVTDIEVSFFGE